MQGNNGQQSRKEINHYVYSEKGHGERTASKADVDMKEFIKSLKLLICVWYDYKEIITVIISKKVIQEKHDSSSGQTGRKLVGGKTMLI